MGRQRALSSPSIVAGVYTHFLPRSFSTGRETVSPSPPHARPPPSSGYLAHSGPLVIAIVTCDLLGRLEQEGGRVPSARPKKTKRRRIVIGSGDRYLTLSALHNFCGVERGPAESLRREKEGAISCQSEERWEGMRAHNEWRKIE